MGERERRNCGQAAGAGVYCRSCADPITTKALMVSTASGRNPDARVGLSLHTTPSVQVAGGRVHGNLRVHRNKQRPGGGPARHEPRNPAPRPDLGRRTGAQHPADIDVSGAAGVVTRNDWRSVDSKLHHGDLLGVAALDRIG